jgi:hypothetical protein
MIVKYFNVHVQSFHYTKYHTKQKNRADQIQEGILNPLDGFSLRLSVLPSSGGGRVGRNSAEAQASIVKLQALKSDIHLPRVVLRRASNETSVLVRKVAERLAFGEVPTSLDISLRNCSRVGNGVLDSTGLGVDVHLLAAGDDGSHSEGVVAAGEVGGVAGRAAADVLDVRRAVGGCGLVEPEGLVGGGDGLVVDWRGGARGDEAEVLGRGGEEEGVEGGDGGKGLHVGGCFCCLDWVGMWLLSVKMAVGRLS